LRGYGKEISPLRPPKTDETAQESFVAVSANSLEETRGKRL